MGKSIEQMMKELEAEGITPEKDKIVISATDENSFEDKIISDIEKASNRKFSDEQLKILKYKGSSCIVACAGSGKTTSTISLIAKRIISREIVDIAKLVYITYSKSGADEMKERLTGLLKKLGLNLNINVQTIHAFFLHIIRTFGVNSNVISNGERSAIIREACKLNGIINRDDEAETVNNLLSYQVNNLLSDKEAVESTVNTLDELDENKYKNIREYYAVKKMEKHLIDYDDMQQYLYYWMVECKKSSDTQKIEMANNVINYCKALYRDFYIDEAQDVSKIQYAIIREMVSFNGKLDRNLTFLGDDDQCIYQWRGSDPSIILGIGAEFNMNTFMLSTNYRCSENILQFASKGIQYNEVRYEKEMKSIKENGKLQIAISGNKDMLSVSKIAMNQIEEWVENGEKYSDIAILVRNNLHAALLSNMLLRKGIYVLQADNMKLTKSYGFKCIKELINLTDKGKEYDHALLSKSLWGLCRFMGLKNSNAIGKFMRDNGLTILDTLGYLNKQFGNKYDIQFDKNVVVNNTSIVNMSYLFNKLSYETRGDLVNVYNALKLALIDGDRVEGIKTLIWMYLEASSFLFKALDKKRYMQGLASYIIRLMQEDGFNKAMELIKVIEQLEGGNMVIPGEKIVLSTIHGAKGREWKNVIMLASDTISQPSYDRIKTMIENKTPISAISRELDEERRLFYVGCTRAINNLMLITYRDTSPFILEAIGAVKENKMNNIRIMALACNTVYEGKSEEEIEDIKKDKQFVEDIITNEILKNTGKYYYKGNEKFVNNNEKEE